MSRLTVNQLEVRGLAPCSLQLDGGDCLSLSGPSGSGKSLLLRAINDLDPAAGEVSLDDTPRDAMPAHVWRRQVVLIPAEMRWWHPTVGEHFASSDGVDTGSVGFEQDVMQWQVDKLSTGEKQRLGLLRALALQPKVLLLDEPTASLDPANINLIETLIADLRAQRNCAVLWVSHDRDQALRVADRHARIRDGRLEIDT